MTMNSGAVPQPGGIYYLPPQARQSLSPTIDDGLTDAAVADEITEFDDEVAEAEVVEEAAEKPATPRRTRPKKAAE